MLQKLENDVRQHIRVEQQMKIYQDSQDQKIEDADKKIKDLEFEISMLKKSQVEVETRTEQLMSERDKWRVDCTAAQKALEDKVKKVVELESAVKRRVVEIEGL